MLFAIFWGLFNDAKVKLIIDSEIQLLVTIIATVKLDFKVILVLIISDKKLGCLFPFVSYDNIQGSSYALNCWR